MSSILLSSLALTVAVTGVMIGAYRAVKKKRWSLQLSRVSDQWLADHKRGRT